MNARQVTDFRLPDPNDMNRYSDWEIDFRQIEPGSMESRVRVRPAGSVTLLRIDLPRAFHQRGCTPDGAVTVGIPLSGLRYWNGKEMDAPCLLGFGQGREFDSVSGDKFSGLTISIALSYLNRLCDQLGQPYPYDFLQQSALPMRRMPGCLLQLQGYVLSSLDQPGRPFGAAEQEDLVACLIDAAASTDSERIDDRSTLSERAKCIKRAVEFIEHYADECPLISEICAYANVSWRTLDRSFKERFGIGPKTYLNRYRLVRFRSDLLSMQDGECIADVANAWGFWHMGQFAKDYCRMFGELPSETLRAARN